ncbi:hypothetical protein HZH68_005291 [Vespula germanica]|uniref:Uncharacterized protein n=1 Tax=Vespula germanica TaxID=30212 RepID=A0A834KG02_VESGE|nr:hypothetical protein HZH68_005291 [Vespula germanica]
MSWYKKAVLFNRLVEEVAFTRILPSTSLSNVTLVLSKEVLSLAMVTTFVKSRIGIGRYPETDRDSWWKEGRTGRGGGTETKRIHPLSSVGKAAAVDLAAPLM